MNDKKVPITNAMGTIDRRDYNTSTPNKNQEKTPRQLFLFNETDLLLPKPKGVENVKKAQ